MLAGVVSLGLAFHGVQGKMLASQVDSHGRLPVSDRLVPGQGEVPPGAAVGLAEPPLLSELACRRGYLLGRVDLTSPLAQDVDSRRLHVLVEPHGATHIGGLVAEPILVEHVPGVDHVVPLAPLADLASEGVDEQGGDAVVVVVSGRGDALAVHVEEQFRQVAHDAVAVPFLERLGQLAGPRCADAGTGELRVVEDAAVVRLVGEDPGDDLAEVFAESFSIGLVCDADEFFDGLAAERVEVGVPVVPTVARRRLDAKDQHGLTRCELGAFALRHAFHVAGAGPVDGGGVDGQGIGVPLHPARAVELVKGQGAGAVPGVLRNQPPGRPAGPAILIVQPGFHSELFGLVDAGADAVEPLFRQIRRAQSDAGVHEEPAEPHSVHDADLPAKFLRVQPPVPRPKRFAPVLVSRAGQLAQQ